MDEKLTQFEEIIVAAYVCGWSMGNRRHPLDGTKETVAKAASRDWPTHNAAPLLLESLEELLDSIINHRGVMYTAEQHREIQNKAQKAANAAKVRT